MPEVEIRCPRSPNRLFMKMLLSGEPPLSKSENLIELACSDCARALRKEGADIFRVLHRYDILGNLVETAVIYSNGRELVSGGFPD